MRRTKRRHAHGRCHAATCEAPRNRAAAHRRRRRLPWRRGRPVRRRQPLGQYRDRQSPGSAGAAVPPHPRSSVPPAGRSSSAAGRLVPTSSALAVTAVADGLLSTRQVRGDPADEILENALKSALRACRVRPSVGAAADGRNNFPTRCNDWHTTRARWCGSKRSASRSAASSAAARRTSSGWSRSTGGTRRTCAPSSAASRCTRRAPRGGIRAAVRGSPIAPTLLGAPLAACMYRPYKCTQPYSPSIKMHQEHIGAIGRPRISHPVVHRAMHQQHSVCRCIRSP
eukprot:scaffold131057_cov66-Phaeocystis_antarctica.AAC.3